MSRTRKGSKGPGWEPWSNKTDKQEQSAESRAALEPYITQAELDEECSPEYPCDKCKRNLDVE